MKQKLDFKKGNGILPAIIQDYTSGRIYMLGYLNQTALRKTLRTGFVHFWSRSRQKLWLKGEESGNRLKLKKVLTDCDQDTLLIQVELLGNSVCHTGNPSCFYTAITTK